VGALRRATKVRPVDEAASFEINPKEHKKKMRERKIRELERRTTSEGERKAAKLKLKVLNYHQSESLMNIPTGDPSLD
jgi:hypothetical protein